MTAPEQEEPGLGASEKRWIADRIRQHCAARLQHPVWDERLKIEVDNLLWAYSVDAKVEGRIRRDAWVPSGKRLQEVHFRRVPFTDAAWRHLQRREPKKIKREHIVPRAHLSSIVAAITTIDDTMRVLDAYAVVALVSEGEVAALQFRSTMPTEWDRGVDWRRPPAVLPDPWARYRAAGVRLRYYDGRPAWE